MTLGTSEPGMSEADETGVIDFVVAAHIDSFRAGNHFGLFEF